MKIKLTNQDLIDAIALWLEQEGHIGEFLPNGYLTVSHDIKKNYWYVDIEPD